MNKDFLILFELLEDRTREVTGHTATPALPEIRKRIARFAAGTCSEEERAQVKKMLLENPDLIPVLVMETRALKQSNE